MKICKKCEQPKELTDFYKNTTSCKSCSILRNHEWVKKNREKRKIYRKRSYENDKDGAKAQYIMYHYGITLDEFRSLLLKQNGLCAICEKPETVKHKSGVLKQLSIDHDHLTKKIRGLLCYNCNRGIGHLQDNPGILSKAALYLEKNK